MRHFKIAFDGVTISLAQENSRAEILRYSPPGKCPALKDNNIIVWDSLAIIEYLADNEPRTAIWPRPRAARAKARALCAEMHWRFESLRAALPMNMRRKVKKRELSPETAADVERIANAFSVFRGRRDVCACGQPFARL
jgi:glutathione S-transferase